MKFLVLAKNFFISYILFGHIQALHAKDVESSESESESVLGHMIVAGVLGAVAVPFLAVGASALIPVAMANFGTAVAGVGTTHASLAAGGCAAALQSIAATLMTTSATAAGAAIGATIGLVASAGTDDDESKETGRKKK